jgi:DNA-binding response OmpR family regulator
VLVVDQALNGEDGLSIVERRCEEGNFTPVLVVGPPTSVERINGLKAGVDDYLVRPFDVRELAARVSNI